jgi:hypothetical protein
VPISPPGLNHIRTQDSPDQLSARLGQEQFEQAQAEAMAIRRAVSFFAFILIGTLYMQ